MATAYFFGHRGYSSIYPENTMIAFEEAVAAGACGFELDVVKSADGVLFIMHDDTVDRTTNGTGKCSELNWDYIQTLDAGSHKSKDFAGEPVPSLEQVLDNFNKKNCWILLEIKDGYTDIATDVVEMITAKGMEKQLKIQSFNWDYIDTVQSVNPDIATGLLGSFASTAQHKALSSGHDFLSLSTYTSKAVNNAQTYGLETFVWTENNTSDIQHYIDLGTDGIIGNDVSLFMDAALANNISQCYPLRQLPVAVRKEERVMVTYNKNAAGDWLRC